MIIASNRGPLRFERRADGKGFTSHLGAGGVATALGPLLEDAPEGTIWVASALTDDDRAAVRAGEARAAHMDLRLLDLDPQTARLHLDVVSNGVLWFLHHGLFDLARRPRFDRRFQEAWRGYEDVNRAFADTVCELASDGDVVLVQDYQLSLTPGYIRTTRPDLRVVHFTHTPFAGPNAIRVLPWDVATALCESLSSVPCGFHATRWADCFVAATRQVLGADRATTAPFVASLGPDIEALTRTAESEAARAAARELDDLVGDRQLVLRIDRIDLSKNLLRGFAAYDLLLEEHREWRERVVFVAMVNPSRATLPEYRAYRNEVEQAVARVNDRWATSGWDPVVLDSRDDFHRSVAGLGRYDVLLVNPLNDGLNLVAKEGPLLNQRDGLVCLSTEAGAFEELGEAVIPVHPYDLVQTADALHTALTMPRDERVARAARLRDLAGARTNRDWLADLVKRAEAATMQ